MITRIVPAAALFAGVLLISGIREQLSSAPRIPMPNLPATMLGKKGKDLVVGEEERRVAGMSDYSMRSFGDDSAPDFTVYVGYYDKQVQGKSIHSPKNCLPGAGWEIMSSERRSLPASIGPGSVNRVVLSNRGVRALVYYWYQGRGRVEASEYRVKWNLLVDAARFGRTEEALVRIVIPVKPRSGDNALTTPVEEDRTAWQLIAQLTPEVKRALPEAPGGVRMLSTVND